MSGNGTSTGVSTTAVAPAAKPKGMFSAFSGCCTSGDVNQTVANAEATAQTIAGDVAVGVQHVAKFLGTASKEVAAQLTAIAYALQAIEAFEKNSKNPDPQLIATLDSALQVIDAIDFVLGGVQVVTDTTQQLKVPTKLSEVEAQVNHVQTSIDAITNVTTQLAGLGIGGSDLANVTKALQGASKAVAEFNTVYGVGVAALAATQAAPAAASVEATPVAPAAAPVSTLAPA